MLLSEEKRIITITTEDDSLEAFLVADDVEINISGLDYPLLTNVLVNDTVMLTVENGTVSAITVENRSVKDTVKGTVLAIDTDNRVITLETQDGYVEVYEVNEQAEFLIDDRTTSNILQYKEILKSRFSLLITK